LDVYNNNPEEDDLIDQLVFDPTPRTGYYMDKNTTFENLVELYISDAYQESQERAEYYADGYIQRMKEDVVLVEDSLRHIADTVYGEGTKKADELYNYLINAKGKVTINFTYEGQTEPETPAEPEQPVEEPETPAEPEQPVEEPETPAEPEQPVEEPETPAEPEQPVEEPETPAEPEQPVEEPETPAEPEQPVEEPETPAEPEIPVYDGMTYDELIASTDQSNPTIDWEETTIAGLDSILTDGSSYMTAVEGTNPSQYTYNSPTNIGNELKVFEANDDSNRIGQIVFNGGHYYINKNATLEMRIDESWKSGLYDSYEEAKEAGQWAYDINVSTANDVEQAIRHVSNAAYGAGSAEAEELYNYMINAKGRVTINFK
jgi:hypothetical protein